MSPVTFRPYGWALAVTASVLAVPFLAIVGIPAVLFILAPLTLGAGIEYRIHADKHRKERLRTARQEHLYAALNAELDAFHADREKTRAAYAKMTPSTKE